MRSLWTSHYRIHSIYVFQRLLSHGCGRGVILDCPTGLAPIHLVTVVVTFAIVWSRVVAREEVAKVG